jgi:hypothetical protein
MFAFTVLYVKREIQLKMFDSWKLYVNKRLRAKYVTVHRILFLRKLILRKWGEFTRKK